MGFLFSSVLIQEKAMGKDKFKYQYSIPLLYIVFQFQFKMIKTFLSDILLQILKELLLTFLHFNNLKDIEYVDIVRDSRIP